MSVFHHICEEIRSAVDDLGAKGCYKKSVKAFSAESGIPEDGLWAAVDAVLQGFNLAKSAKKLQRSYGGTPDKWTRWFEIAKTKPDCPRASEVP